MEINPYRAFVDHLKKRRLTMNIYEEIDQETMILLLDSLCKRTVELLV